MARIHIADYSNQNSNSRLDARLESLGIPLPDQKVISQCLVGVAPGVILRGYAWGDEVFVESAESTYFHTWVGGNVRLESLGANEEDDLDGDEPQEKCGTAFFRAEILTAAFTKTIETRKRIPGGFWGQEQKIQDVDAYKQGTRNSYYDNYREAGTVYVPYAYLTIRIHVEGAEPVEGDFKFFQPETGVAVFKGSMVEVTSNFHGMSRVWQESLATRTPGRYEDAEDSGLAVLYRHLQGSVIPDGMDVWWERFFSLHSFPFGKDTAGLSSALNRKDIKPVIERLQKDAPLDWTFFQWLQSSATVDKQKNNSLLSAFLLKVGTDYDALVEALQIARTTVAPSTSPSYHHYSVSEKAGAWHMSRRAICLTLPGAVEKVEEQEAKADWRKRKTNSGQADGLGITEAFPLLRAAVEAGKIPTSVFHQPSGEPVNVEFDLWEKALGQEGWAEVLYDIAQTASRRGTYEKDISPFLAFLFRLPKYLEKHTGKTWKVLPSFVESQWQLEMDDQDENGTTKRRSAFTPVADNKTCVITVPYVAVQVTGVRTQWCYSRFYHLFEEGFTDPISGGIVTRDFEPKLNGRDDYGLMFYTLTGTDTARGYPTFLIIFERLSRWEPVTDGKGKKVGGECLVEETRVHFHRVRPQRLKDGKHTPACKLIEACYQYMAGNIPASDITAQQGDLIFIKHSNDPIVAGAKTEPPRDGLHLEFESHRFEPVAPGALMRLYESTAKQPANRLGFLWAPGGLRVTHPEHMNLEGLGEGWYEIRRCKSWEANPKAIWSLTID